jgi:uncharacterized protein with GYD domain
VPAYFILGKFTAEGLELLVRDRTEEGKHGERLTIDEIAMQIATDVGVDLVGCWITAGVYDAILQLEAQGSRDAIAFAIALGATVGMRTETIAADKGYGSVLAKAGGSAHTRHLGLYGHTRHAGRDGG